MLAGTVGLKGTQSRCQLFFNIRPLSSKNGPDLGEGGGELDFLLVFSSQLVAKSNAFLVFIIIGVSSPA